MKSIYKFKYEKDGKIYASKDMLPSEDDILLIDRDVLEGKEEPKPVPGPVPHGEKKIVENGKYDITAFASVDVNVPTGITPSGQLKIVENGVYDITTKASVNVEVPSGPAPEPIVKGSVIKLGGEEYRVLSVNDDLTDCEVMHVGPATLSKFSNASPSQEPSAGTTFIVNGEEKTGLKYEGSLLDTACEAFYDELPADVKAAIIEQEVEQDMYDTNAAEGTEDFIIDNSAEGGMVYRFKKVNDAPVVVGTRHAYALSCSAIKEYFGGTSVKGLNVAKVFQLQSWFKDAYSNNAGSACFLYCGDGGGVSVRISYSAGMCCACPAFHIDLTKINL